VSVENKVSLLSSDDDVDNKIQNRENEFNLTSGLISAIKVRPPLFDHTMPLSERSESIKNRLWNEVFDELQGEDILIFYLYKKIKYIDKNVIFYTINIR